MDLLLLPLVEDPDLPGDLNGCHLVMPIFRRDIPHEPLLSHDGTLATPAIVGSQILPVLTLLEGGLWLAGVVHDDITLPDHGPCAGDGITVLMTTFLIDGVVVLSLVALDEIQVTKSERCLARRELVRDVIGDLQL